MSIQHEVKLRELESRFNEVVLELADMHAAHEALMAALGKINSALDAIKDTVSRIHD